MTIILLYQGKYKAAEAADRRALKRREKLLEKKHPDILNNIYSLACTVGGQDKHEAAEAMHRRTLKERERILGKEHPDTLRSVNTLVIIL